MLIVVILNVDMLSVVAPNQGSVVHLTAFDKKRKISINKHFSEKLLKPDVFTVRAVLVN
jgi:hypothetical protein